MKASIEIPDALYRQVKAKSALEGKAVREVAINLFQGWVLHADSARDRESAAPHNRPTPSWFGGARNYARHIQKHDMESIRRSITKGRMSESDGHAT